VIALSEIDRIIKKKRLESDLLAFTKWYFEEVKKETFIPNWHHESIANVLYKIYNGELKHVVITIPPRYTKTELVVKAFVAWTLAKNRKSKFIHLSYSDDLALDNSSNIRELIQSDEFQAIWPMKLKSDSQSKKKWFNLDGGGVYATATGGQITGFGAGAIDSTSFQGAIIIDDPLKPDDARSDIVRMRINERFNNTIKSRTNSKNTPIIVIQQRIHEDDMAGFLLTGGSEYKFHHLNLPAINEDGPSEYDPRQAGEALWPMKHDVNQLRAMEAKSPMVFAGQYQQRPAPLEGNIIKQDQINYYVDLPKTVTYFIHSWDFTFKQSSTSDYVVGTVWGRTTDKTDFYLIDLIRAKMSFTDSLSAIKHLATKHSNYHAILVEEKANGAAIIDSLRREVNRIIAINPTESKEARFEAVAPIFAGGNVYLPHKTIAPWVELFVQEVITFPNAKHDDQCDSMSQALNFLDQKAAMPFNHSKKYDSFTTTFLKKPKEVKQRIEIPNF